MGGGWTSSRAAQQCHALLARSAGEDPEDVDASPRPVDEKLAPPHQERRRRHCWVLLPDVEPMAGVVAGWDRTEGGGWSARVAYVLGDETGSVVTGWVPASCLRPYGTG